jgi:uncharacterized protein YjgD (DUF1641 family)
MAERLHYTVKPPEIGPDAQEELERLLQTLHEHGVLRFANDLVASNTQVAQVVVNGLSKEGSVNAVRNLSALGMAISSVPPDTFYKATFAVRDALQQIGEYQPKAHDDEAPGVTGAYRLLHDDQLWQSIAPLTEGLKAFARRLDEDIDQPVTDFTGKQTGK